jgi:lipopolysaccharide export system protein LptC
MMGKLRYILILLLVIGIALFTRWLLTAVERPPKPTVSAPRHEMDYFLTDFTATVMNAAGQPYYRLRAQHLEHYPDTDTLELQAPRLRYFSNPELPWLAEARTGTVYQDTRMVRLDGDVTIKRLGDLPAKHMTLVTDRLRIDTRDHTAETDADVKITTQNSTIEATGLWVSLDEDRLTLLSNARGVYVP